MYVTTTQPQNRLTVVVACASRRQASRNAAKFTEDGRFDDKRAGQLPAFEQARAALSSSGNSTRRHAVYVVMECVRQELSHALLSSALRCITPS